MAEGWGGGAALGTALTPAPVTPGILPSALRARLRRFEIRSRQICPQAALTGQPHCGEPLILSDRSEYMPDTRGRQLNPLSALFEGAGLGFMWGFRPPPVVARLHAAEPYTSQIIPRKGRT